MMMPPRKCDEETVSVSISSNKNKGVLLQAIIMKGKDDVCKPILSVSNTYGVVKDYTYRSITD